ncbi:MAG: hypothetical protein IT335_02475 [Thermomicrobiales bacterium]|jgi:hypothetical protein|nr:hypothetical protein [Thermomicrobiales bacterium]
MIDFVVEPSAVLGVEDLSRRQTGDADRLRLLRITDVSPERWAAVAVVLAGLAVVVTYLTNAFDAVASAAVGVQQAGIFIFDTVIARSVDAEEAATFAANRAKFEILRTGALDADSRCIARETRAAVLPCPACFAFGRTAVAGLTE